jgi:hypothetical protein
MMQITSYDESKGNVKGLGKIVITTEHSFFKYVRGRIFILQFIVYLSIMPNGLQLCVYR